ncbi:tyramine oxidase subunit B [Propionicicella superfundia]|uniref:tyramine oxidase subunit B n=1 Tax=Propionicicella superfundia TaxID=348582 RepID=UPI000410E53D|nr:tyramine oxidase subunit B [Propionicicella superfundia]
MPRTQFLYLSEPDMIAAGVLDAARCVDVSEEVFGLLADGDYLMGGSNHNSHGMGIVFPKETIFPNMPVAGPDRRFVAMPGYLGGRFDVCGVKWYGSNQANPSTGLPRSVLTVMLNDKETGEPLCLMSANLLSSARTGAVPGVAARYLVREGSETAAVLGCGPINRACFKAIVGQVPSIRRVYCYDLFEENARRFADWAGRTFGIEGIVEPDLPAALADADVVSVAASRLKPLVVQDAWFKKGSTILVSGPIRPDDAFWTLNRIVYDNIHLHEAYVEEAVASADKQASYDGVIGGPIYRLIDAGRLPGLADSLDLGHIVRGAPGERQNDEEKIAFVACGMSVFDLGWGYELYRTALDKGLGTTLPLWDEPYAE